MKPREKAGSEMRGSRVAVIGANGQLGTDLVKALDGWDLVPLTLADIEICDFVHTRQVLERIKPDFVINTAAFVRVDDCEEEVGQAFSVNAFAARNLAQICADLDCTLVHISTDYVFDGQKREPYTEEDLPNPINVYGASKLAGEHFVRAICPKHLIVRTSGLYGKAGSSGKGGNFVETMIRLAQEGKPIRVVDDQVFSPTYARDLAVLIEEAVQKKTCGLHHFANSGQCTWYEFARKAFELVGLDPELTATTAREFGAKARRPTYSVLSSSTRHRSLPVARPWEQALAAYLLETGRTLVKARPDG